LPTDDDSLGVDALPTDDDDLAALPTDDAGLGVVTLPTDDAGLGVATLPTESWGACEAEGSPAVGGGRGVEHTRHLPRWPPLLVPPLD